jgi:hypothetical protein
MHNGKPHRVTNVLHVARQLARHGADPPRQHRDRLEHRAAVPVEDKLDANMGSMAPSYRAGTSTTS